MRTKHIIITAVVLALCAVGGLTAFAVVYGADSLAPTLQRLGPAWETHGGAR